MIANAEMAVEERSLSRVEPFLSERYRDEMGRQQKDLLRLLAGYYLRNQSIHLLVQINDIQLSNEDSAAVTLYAALAGQPITGTEQLLSFRADLFRFDLQLRKEDDTWRLVSGKWRRASKSDFLE